MNNSFAHLAYQRGYLELGAPFYTILQPTPLADAHWIAHSAGLAQEMGLSTEFIHEPDVLELLSGNSVASNQTMFASVYSGHQFGIWAGQLGDGRAITLGQIKHQEQLWEIQLKGAGPTPYSRRADGRAVLRSSIREFLCSEAMHALHIPTTRALALIGSSLPIIRETVETAAVVTRVAPCFIRFGHFEHFAANGLHAELQELTNFVIKHHYPQFLAHDQPYFAFFEEVLKRSAKLVAQWQSVGFCHGVLNTDNMSILGLTLDYGPFGFMDQFDLNHICNHTDVQGRYAFAKQPQIFYWNLVCLAQALLPILAQDESDVAIETAIAQLKPILAQFSSLYLQHYQGLMSEKLGLMGDTSPASIRLIEEIISLLDKNRVDYTHFFRQLADMVNGSPSKKISALFKDANAFESWAENLRKQIKTLQYPLDAIVTRMHAINPTYILRQHLAQEAIQAAQAGDFSMVQQIHQCLKQPFKEQPEFARFADLPPDWARHLEISCSS